LNAIFRGKGASPTNCCQCQKTGVIALLCGIKISAVDCLVLSQSTHVKDGQTDGQDYDSQDCVTIAALHGKNVYIRINIWGAVEFIG